MGHDHEGAFAAKVEKKVKDLGADGGIEVARRFIGQNDFRIVHQRAGNGDPLLLASGQFKGTVRKTVAEANGIQQGTRTIALGPPGCAKGVGGQKDVFDAVHLGHEVVGLEDESNVAGAKCCAGAFAQAVDVGVQQADGTRIGAVKPPEKMEEGGLARAGSAEDCKALAGGHGKVGTLEHPYAAPAKGVCLGDAFGADGKANGGGDGKWGKFRVQSSEFKVRR